MEIVGFNLVLLSSFLCATCAGSDVPMMIADVIRTEEKPTTVLATVCWNDDMKKLLRSKLSSIQKHHAATLQIAKPGMIPTNFVQPQHVYFVVDLGCSDIEEHLQMSNSKQLFRAPFRWLLISGFNNDSLNSVIPGNVEDLDMLPDSEVLVARQTGNSSYELCYIYKVDNGRPWQVEPYANWNINGTLQKKDRFTEPSALRRLNLHKMTIPFGLVATTNDTLEHMTDGVNGHIDTTTKVNYPGAFHLYDFLNASNKFFYYNTWGYKVNGSYNGLVGALYSGEIEVGISPFFVTIDRLPLLEYISRPTATELKFVFMQPKLSYTQNLYLLSFQPSVWYCLSALMFVMFLGLFAVTKWEWARAVSNKAGPKERTLRGNIQDVALFTVGAICQQGSPVEPKGGLGRIVSLHLFIAVMFIYTSYSANIVALLQSSSSNIRTPEDLLHTRIKLAVPDMPYTRFYLPRMKDPIKKAVYETKIAPPGRKPNYMDMVEGVKNIIKGFFAYYMEVGVGYQFVAKYFEEGEKCALQEMTFLPKMEIWQAVKKYTPYKEMYKIGFKRILEAGLQTRENLRLYYKKPKCSGRDSSFISVGMVDCYPALLVLAYGVILSLLALVAEIVFEKRKRMIDNVLRHHEISRRSSVAAERSFLAMYSDL